MCQCHLDFERTKGPFSFCLGYFSSAKKFNHIAKDVNILHLKSGGNHRFNYFLTSTPLGHISHLHDWLITSGWFLIWKNTTESLQVVGFWYGKIRLTYYKQSTFDMDRFWHLVWAKLTSCKFSLFFFLIHLYIFLIYGVSINKVLQGCINIVTFVSLLSTRNHD